MEPGRQEWLIGLHQFEFEPPDILWVKHWGPLSLPEALIMTEQSLRLLSARPFFLVSDMADAGPLAPEAGRYFGESFPYRHLLGLIYIKGRLLHRATAKGILLASYMTESTKDRAILDIGHFVSTREEACALIVELRAAAAARRPAGENPGTGSSFPPVRGPSW